MKPFEFVAYSAQIIPFTEELEEKEIPIELEVLSMEETEKETENIKSSGNMELSERSEAVLASPNDIQNLEYAVVTCVSLLFVVGILFYLRSKKNRKRLD